MGSEMCIRDRYRTAIDLHLAGLSVPAIIDVRESSSGQLALEVKNLGIKVKYGKGVAGVSGKRHVKSVLICSPLKMDLNLNQGSSLSP